VVIHLERGRVRDTRNHQDVDRTARMMMLAHALNLSSEHKGVVFLVVPDVQPAGGTK
jgi:hypothetical protein